jgi:hypothetical protein
MDHPHVHCVIPGGALMGNGKWKHCPKNFLFPIKPLSALFKGKLLDYFKKAIETGDIELCGSLQQYKNKPVLQTLLDTLYKTQWVVYVKPQTQQDCRTFPHIISFPVPLSICIFIMRHLLMIRSCVCKTHSLNRGFH